jgi:hypothetical protein
MDSVFFFICFPGPNAVNPGGLGAGPQIKMGFYQTIYLDDQNNLENIRLVQINQEIPLKSMWKLTVAMSL